MARVAVIIPAYNHKEELCRTLEALFSQTYKDFEVIIVDDGSTDNTHQALTQWLGRIKLLRTQNSGAPAARNYGAKQATGEFLLFLDADVTLRHDALEKFVYTLERESNAAFVYSSFKFGWKKFKGMEWDEVALKEKNYVHTTSLLRSTVFPGFDESLKKFQDWDLWLTMVKLGYKGLWIPEVLFTVTPRANGISKWLPKFVYTLPWKPARARQYEEAAKIIKSKHNLC